MSLQSTFQIQISVLRTVLIESLLQSLNLILLKNFLRAHRITSQIPGHAVIVHSVLLIF